MNRPTTIYAVVDPRNNEVRYVGKTVRKLNQRLSEHLRSKANTYCAKWFRKLKSEGIKPEMLELEIVTEDWQGAEIFWIAYLRWLGARLVNYSAGGEGVLVKPEVRANMRASCSKVTADQVMEIHKLHNTGEYMQLELANMFNMSIHGIKSIIYGANWNDVYTEFQLSSYPETKNIQKQSGKDIPYNTSHLASFRDKIAKVTAGHAMEILIMYDTGDYSQTAISKKLGINLGIVKSITRGRSWKDVYTEFQLNRLNNSDGNTELQAVHTNVKVTTDQVMEILILHDTGDYKQKVIAKMFGVTPTCIRYITSGETWKEVYAEFLLNRANSGVTTELKAVRTEATATQVMEVLMLYSTGEHSTKTLAKMFNRSPSNINSILRGTLWKDIYAEFQLIKENNSLVN